MRKFKFIGDPVLYDWDERPIKDKIYLGTHTGKNMDLESMPIQDFKEKGGGDDSWMDWEEVTEPETTRIPNQDQPASSMTKFEMAVLNNIKGYLNSNPFNISDKEIVKQAILLAKETFKQLEDEKQL